MKRRVATILLVVMICVPGASALSAEGQDKVEVTISELLAGIKDYEKKKITVRGVAVGTCISGGKLWISEGEYQKGKPVVLVRAKDDAFKFDRNAVGKEVSLVGYPLAYYADYCSSEDKQSIDHDKKVTHSQEMEGKEKDLKGITFIAETVNYH